MNRKSLKSLGKEEWWCEWYECSVCKGRQIAESFNFCPDCGEKIKEKKEKK